MIDEQILFEYFRNLYRLTGSQPLVLGGVAGYGGGSGGPPGGFIGVLPQTRVAYDITEAASLDTPASATLVDNLNHIRYRLNELVTFSGMVISGGIGGHIIRDSGSYFSQRPYLRFLGNVTVIDTPGEQSTDITILTSSGEGGGFTGSKIVLFDSSGASLAEYDADATGLSSATTDATSGDTIFIPLCTIESDYTFKENISYLGLSREYTTLSGIMTIPSGNVYIKNLTMLWDDTSLTEKNLVTLDPGSNLKIENCKLYIKNSDISSEPVIGCINALNGGYAIIKDSELTAVGATSICIRIYDVTAVIKVYGGTMNSEYELVSDY